MCSWVWDAVFQEKRTATKNPCARAPGRREPQDRKVGGRPQEATARVWVLMSGQRGWFCPMRCVMMFAFRRDCPGLGGEQVGGMRVDGRRKANRI